MRKSLAAASGDADTKELPTATCDLPTMHGKRLLCLFFPAFALTAGARGEPSREAIDFERDVQPIVSAHCVKCHGPEKQESGLRLDNPAFITQGGDNGAAIVAGKAADSLLVQALEG